MFIIIKNVEMHIQQILYFSNASFFLFSMKYLILDLILGFRSWISPYLYQTIFFFNTGICTITRVKNVNNFATSGQPSYFWIVPAVNRTAVHRTDRTLYHKMSGSGFPSTTTARRHVSRTCTSTSSMMVSNFGGTLYKQRETNCNQR